MNPMSRLHRSLLLACLAPAWAQAGTATNTFQVQATVVSSCQVTGTSFGRRSLCAALRAGCPTVGPVAAS